LSLFAARPPGIFALLHFRRIATIPHLTLVKPRAPLSTEGIGMRVALLSPGARSGDAIGQQLAEKVAFFTDHGADVRVFVESDQRLHPAVRPFCQKVDEPLFRGTAWQFLSSADLVIADYCQHYALLDLLPLLAEGKPRVILDYHGVTPAQLWGPENREALEKGARERGLVWCADAGITHSRFARAELTRPTGFPGDRLHRLGYVIDTDWLRTGIGQSLRKRLGLEQATILLFVGRAAPNKRLPVLVEALAELRDVRPAAHAVIIGDTGDVYAAEMKRCRQRAAELGVADRLHFTGQVDPGELRDAYHSADVFVMPSQHEGFCLPVLEAMACGVPVVAARSSALPETVGPAGLTFVPDDARDLARQVRRVLDVGQPNSAPAAGPLHVAVVACRYGKEIVGGAESSLRTIAESLHQAGHRVEVFTTCIRAENRWHDALPPGSLTVDGIRVHRFRIDARDAERYAAAQQQIGEALDPIAPQTEQDFLAHSLRSSALVAALEQRVAGFDAVIVGPYLFGLTHDVAQRFPDKTVLLPCFHDEPAARLPALLETYRQVGSVLYHSPEEQALAETTLGLNHPGAAQVGTWLDLDRAGDAVHGRALLGNDDRPYLLYAGRYSPHKEVPLLLKYARRYWSRHPDRFVFAFVGQGEVAIPAAPWARNLGFVDEPTRRDLMAGAAAVVQLSRLESLSLVALQAWSEGVPVIVSAECDVLAAQVRRARGGTAVGSYEAFDQTLDDLWERRAHWQELGRQGRDYVRVRYGDRAAFTKAVEAAVRGLRLPLAERMRRQGLVRAEAQSRAAWREQFGRIVEEVVHAPPRPARYETVVEPRVEARSVAGGLASLLVPVRIHNRGTQPLIAEGPARTVLRWEVLDEAGAPVGPPAADTPLPGLVMPFQAVPAAVTVTVPERPGTYHVVCRAQRALGQTPAVAEAETVLPPALRLTVEAGTAAPPWASALAETVQQALAQAGELQALPNDYTDVTEGWLADWKQRIKGKLLHNFKKAYVDVLARQQSAFNRQALTVLQELVECCATLEHAQQQTVAAPVAPDTLAAVTQELAQSRQKCNDLERRLARLEALLLGRGMIIT